MNETVACSGYVKVYSAPYTYDHGAKAEREDAKRGSLHGFSNPQKRRIAFRVLVLHPFYGQVKAIGSAKEDVTSC